MGNACICDKESSRIIRPLNESNKIDYKMKKESLQLNIVLKILEQMKTSIFKVQTANYSSTGFFCKIPFPDKSKKLPVLITSYGILKQNEIIHGKSIRLIFYDKKYKIININEERKIYISDESQFNITIIEIINEDGFNIKNMLEIDEGIYNSEYLKYIYKNKEVYFIHYPVNSEIKYEINIITNIHSNSDTFMHLFQTELGSLGAPILNFENYGVIGINSGNNIGTILKKPIEEFINLTNSKNNDKTNEISLTLKIGKDDINKNIFFLDNTDFKDLETNQHHFHDHLKELNRMNTKLYVNGKEFLYTKWFVPHKEGIYTIKLEFNFQLTDCSYMFYWCYNLINIDFTNFDSSQVTNMSNMFALCINLTYLDLSFLNTSKVTNMSNMFYFCKNLPELNLSSFNTEKVMDMSKMFSDCSNIKNINLSSFNTENVISMSHMFFYCKKLDKLDLTYFNTKKVVTMSNMFYFCKTLKKLNLSSFNTKKVFDMSKMFYLCKSLNKIFLSSFDTRNVIDMSHMFSECKSIVIIDVKSFDTRNVSNMSYMFSGANIKDLDLTNFNTKSVKNLSFMFYFCKNLDSINLSSFDTSNVIDMSYMFCECNDLKSLDLSSFNVKNTKNIKSMFEGCINSIKVKVNKNSFHKFKSENEKNIFYI